MARRLILVGVLTFVCLGSVAEEPWDLIPAPETMVEEMSTGFFGSAPGLMPCFDPSTTGIDYKLIVVPPAEYVDFKARIVPGLGPEEPWSPEPNRVMPLIPLLGIDSISSGLIIDPAEDN